MSTNTKWLPMTVIDVHQETEGLMSIQLQLTIDGARFDFRVGQYVQIKAPNGEVGYYAISSEPEQKRYIEFLIKDKPDGASGSLCRLKEGDHVQVSAPQGSGYPVNQFKGKHILLVGMGTSISALRPVIKSTLMRPERACTMTLVYGLREPQEMPFIDDFRLWEKRLRVEIAVSQPGKAFWNGYVGRVTGLIPKLNLAYTDTVACLCGSKDMQNEVSAQLISLGLKKENIFLNH